jgi:hypothetical protein
LEFKSQQGSIFVEVEDAMAGPATRSGRPTSVKDAGESLGQMLARLGPVLKDVVSQVRAQGDSPDEVSVEFGIRISTDANVIIVRTSGEANFRIAITWSGTRR